MCALFAGKSLRGELSIFPHTVTCVLVLAHAAPMKSGLKGSGTAVVPTSICLVFFFGDKQRSRGSLAN